MRFETVIISWCKIRIFFFFNYTNNIILCKIVNSDKCLYFKHFTSYMKLRLAYHYLDNSNILKYNKLASIDTQNKECATKELHISVILSFNDVSITSAYLQKYRPYI